MGTTRAILPQPALQVIMGPDGMLQIGRAGLIRLDPKDAMFAQAVIADLGNIAALAEGRELFARTDALGHVVSIVKPAVPTDPANAWTVPDDLAAATAVGVDLSQPGGVGAIAMGTGTGCGSTIAYDPADWPWRGVADSPTSTDVLLTMLRQAVLNASGTSGSVQSWPGDRSVSGR